MVGYTSLVYIPYLHPGYTIIHPVPAAEYTLLYRVARNEALGSVL